MCQASHHARVAASQSAPIVPHYSINNTKLTEYNVGCALWNALNAEQCALVPVWKKKVLYSDSEGVSP